MGRAPAASPFLLRWRSRCAYAYLDRGNFGEDYLGAGTFWVVSEWRELTERLVEVNLAIEDREGWATRPEDVEELERLETLRDDLQDALAHHHVRKGLRKRLREEEDADPARPQALEPRD